MPSGKQLFPCDSGACRKQRSNSTWIPDTAMASAGWPAMTLLRPHCKSWMAGLRPMGVKIGRGTRLAVPFVMAAVKPTSTPCSAYIGRSRGWRAFARHDVVATAVSPTCYFNAYGAEARHPRLAVSVSRKKCGSRACACHDGIAAGTPDSFVKCTPGLPHEQGSA